MLFAVSFFSESHLLKARSSAKDPFTAGPTLKSGDFWEESCLGVAGKTVGVHDADTSSSSGACLLLVCVTGESLRHQSQSGSDEYIKGCTTTLWSLSCLRFNNWKETQVNLGCLVTTYYVCNLNIQQISPESWTNWYIFLIQTADFSILWNQVTSVWNPEIFVQGNGAKGWRARPCLQWKPIHHAAGAADLLLWPGLERPGRGSGEFRTPSG